MNKFIYNLETKIDRTLARFGRRIMYVESDIYNPRTRMRGLKTIAIVSALALSPSLVLTYYAKNSNKEEYPIEKTYSTDISDTTYLRVERK